MVNWKETQLMLAHTMLQYVMQYMQYALISFFFFGSPYESQFLALNQCSSPLATACTGLCISINALAGKVRVTQSLVM